MIPTISSPARATEIRRISFGLAISYLLSEIGLEKKSRMCIVVLASKVFTLIKSVNQKTSHCNVYSYVSNIKNGKPEWNDF